MDLRKKDDINGTKHMTSHRAEHIKTEQCTSHVIQYNMSQSINSKMTARWHFAKSLQTLSLSKTKTWAKHGLNMAKGVSN